MNKENINPYIEKICQSPQFIKSPTNQELLKFLTDCTLSETILKEYTIAKDVFGKDANDNFNVRVYISNLRKKLAEYYQKEGKDDKLIIRIPQGQYLVEFIEKAALKRKLPVNSLKKLTSSNWFFLVIGVVITLTLTLFLPNQTSIDKQLKNSVSWNGFFENEQPCYIVLGDHYFFTGQLFDSTLLFIRNTSINSDNEFDEFIQEHPDYEKILHKNERTYLSPQSTSCLHTILPIFINNGVETRLRLSSTMGWSDLPGHNLLFIGSYRAINIFERFLEKAGLSFNTKTNILRFSILDNTYEYNYGSSYLQDDYVSVLKLRTDSGSEVLFFLSSFEIGNDAVTKYFINEEQLKVFEKQLPKNNPNCYKALFKVSGSYLTAFKTELLHISPIENEELLKWP